MLFNGSVTTCLKGGDIESFSVEVNSYHVALYAIDRTVGRRDTDSKLLYQRGPMNDEWLDESHKKITNALRALELALQEAVGIEVIDGIYTRVV